MAKSPCQRVNHEEWEFYADYWSAFRQSIAAMSPPLPHLRGDAQEYFLRFFAGDDVWYAVFIHPLSGCIGVNATFRPRTDPAFQNARLRVEQMPCGGWPMHLDWRPMPKSPHFHQVEMRCLADLNNRDLWQEQHRWLARHLWALVQTVDRGVDPMSPAERIVFPLRPKVDPAPSAPPAPYRHVPDMRSVYLVAAEMSGRGLFASPSLGNTAGVDLVAADASSKRTFSVQVNTSTQGGEWLLAKRATVLESDAYVYVFVSIRPKAGGTGEDIQFFVVPSGVVKANLHRTESPSGAEAYSFPQMAADPFRNQWSVFGE